MPNALKGLRPDWRQFKQLLRERGFRELWHFTPLQCVPCILNCGALLSIEQLEQQDLKFPRRASYNDDINAGVKDAVKLSTKPYWKMLSDALRKGEPQALLRFTCTPVYWDGTFFGDRNVWENDWTKDDTIDFARERVFVAREEYYSNSPPEIYVPESLPLESPLGVICTYTEEERQMLSGCLERLDLGKNVRIFSAGHGYGSPFPNDCKQMYDGNGGSVIGLIRTYFERVTLESLSHGVELEI